MLKIIKKTGKFLNRFFLDGMFENAQETLADETPAKENTEISEEDKKFLYDFTSCKEKILQKNKDKIIKKWIPVVQKSIFKSDNLLISEEQAEQSALSLFEAMKETGDIDCLNIYCGKKNV